jgi:hypothetical protein
MSPGGGSSFTIYDDDQLPAAKDWNDVIIAYRNGAPLRVRDIGQAVAGAEDAKQAAWANGKRGIFLVVYKEPGANVIDTVDRIKTELPRLRAAMPRSVSVGILSDRTQTIRASVGDVQFTLLITIACVVDVIFLFLRTFWATVIPSGTVPLSLLATLGLMYLAGFSLHNISLMALTISVGFVVDDAIVMLENVVRHIEVATPPPGSRVKAISALKAGGERETPLALACANRSQHFPLPSIRSTSPHGYSHEVRPGGRLDAQKDGVLAALGCRFDIAAHVSRRRHALPAHLEKHVARLDALFGRRTVGIDAEHNHAFRSGTRNPGSRGQRQSEPGPTLLGLRRLRGGLARLRGNCQPDRLLLAVAPDLQRHGLTRRLGRALAGKIA